MKAERERLIEQKSEFESELDREKSEYESKFNSTGHSFYSSFTDDLDAVRAKLAQTSIDLQEE